MNRPSVAFSLALVALAAALPARAQTTQGSPPKASSVLTEWNLWPLKVELSDSLGIARSQSGLGPFMASTKDAKDSTTTVFRPFYLQRTGSQGKVTETDILYPLFFYRSDGEYWKWSVFNLINRESPHHGAPTARDARGFDIWPFWFSRDTGNPDSSYKALFPIQGPMKNRFGYARIDWTLFPLYARLQDSTRVSTYAPWPFFKIISGPQETGWSLWPLAGHRAEPGKSRTDYLLWPLIYRSTRHLDEPVPSERFGFLPFFAASTAEGYRSESYAWPFFGWSERSAPFKYTEHRYLYPFFIQGHGEERTLERWAPFYTHSIKGGVEKTWILWPLWRDQKWREAGLDQHKSQLLYFLYWSLDQRRPGSPAPAPRAVKTHLWPLLSYWDNGAGRKQVQLLSPLEVFFQHNEEVRLLWSPFFSLYRFEQKEPGNTRGSLLWNAVTWAHDQKAELRSFHLGPLYSREHSPDGARIALLSGLLSWRRSKTGQWALSFADFKSTPARPELAHP